MAHATSPSTERSLSANKEALAMAAQAKVLTGTKLKHLVTRIQRQFGQPQEACWRFVIQYGLKGTVDHRRWSDAEVQFLCEELLKHSVEEVAAKLHRSPEAIRSKLQRTGFNLRNIRGDLLSLENITCALRIQRAEVLLWIDQGWLPASVSNHGGKTSYSITPEALNHLYKHHLQKVLKRGGLNHPVFEAYLHYCSSPKPDTEQWLPDHQAEGTRGIQTMTNPALSDCG
jgi:hypothetical protein